MEIMKIGPVELTREEAEQIYTAGKYIVTYSKIYSVKFSPAQNRFYGSIVYAGKGGMTRRGRHYIFPAEEVNRLVGCKLVRE